MERVAGGFSRAEEFVQRRFSGLSEEKRTEAVATAEVLFGVLHAAFSGLVLTFALAGLALVSRGGRQALLELKHHVLYIHPLIWVLTLMSVCTIMVFRDAKAMGSVRAAFLDPILSFVVHVFGAALGAVPILALSKWAGLLPADPKAGPVVLVCVWALSFLMSLMAQLAMVSAGKPNLKVREWSQVLAFALLAVSVLLLVALSGEGRPSDEGLPGFFESIAERVGR